ncbi:MAG: hypothetical protein ABEJ43_02585 [Haloferacaceae archaeon]
MSDTTHVTTFEDHAKRASVDVPDAVRERLPFGTGETLGIREEEAAVVIQSDPTYSGARAVLRGTESGLRLYVDRTVAYEADLLGADVALTPLDDGLRLERADER